MLKINEQKEGTFSSKGPKEIVYVSHQRVPKNLSFGVESVRIRGVKVRLPDAALGVVRPLLPGCPAKKRLPWPELMED